MSDPTDRDDKDDANKAGDVLPPERHAGLSGAGLSGAGSSEKARKAPPVIEGVAETSGAEKDEGAEASSSTHARGAVNSVTSVFAVSLGAAIVGALVVGGGLFGFGLLSGGRDADPQVLSELAAKVEANATTNAVQSSDLASVTEDLRTAKVAADGAAARDARLDALEASAKDMAATLEAARVAGEAGVARLDEMQKNMPPADIAQRIDTLTAMVKALNTAVDALVPKITDMDARVAALEAKKDDPDAAARAALGLALSNLSRVASRAEPFERELDVVAQFLPSEPELAELKLVASEGVPTEASLEARFPALVTAVLDAERAASDDSAWQKFVSNARKLVTLRRTGEIAGEDTDAVLARMEERMKRGDLSAVIAEARGLKGVAAEAAAPWLKDASARVVTNDLLSALTANVTKRLAQGAQG
ncbi:MAG: mitofilin family membrane protein [Parvibaculum sp.]|nr:mitofilin family membrane protein [Parvibaculum sp.]